MTENSLLIGSFSGPHPSSLKPNEWVDEVKRWPQTESPHIMAYLLRSKACDLKDMEAYKSLESYNYLKSGWVGQVLFYDAGSGVCYLKGDITPSQALSDDAHTAWVCVKHAGEVLTAGCTCMAGLGRVCSHAAAILWKVDMANRKGLTGVSYTDETSKWNQGTKRNIEPALIEDLDFKKPKPGELLGIEPETKSSGRQILEQLYTHEELVSHYDDSGFSDIMRAPGTILHHTACADISKASNLPTVELTVTSVVHNHDMPNDLPYLCTPCLRFYNDMISLSEKQIFVLASKTILQSKCDLWVESRRLRITASTASKVPKTDKGNPIKFLFTHIHKPFQGNQHTKYGSRSEPIALKQFTAKTQLSVYKCGTIVAKNDSWLSASPDGLISNNATLEIKCPVPQKFVPRNSDMVFSNGSFHLNPKGSRGYYYQVQLTMYCTSRIKTYFYVWLSDSEDYLIEVNYDVKFVNDVLQRLRSFYFNHMLPKLVDDFHGNRLSISNMYKQFMKEE